MEGKVDDRKRRRGRGGEGGQRQTDGEVYGGGERKKDGWRWRDGADGSLLSAEEQGKSRSDK